MVEYQVGEDRFGGIHLTLRGEMAGRLWAGRLGRAVRDHLGGGAPTVIHVDVSPLRFMDNFGVATLVALRREFAGRGTRLLVEGARGQVREKLRVAGVLRVLQEGD
jgi:anti-anti-sigma factor